MGFGSGATGRIHIAAKEKRGKDGMNLLIVDDERMETEIIEKLIDRERFPCAGVYTAQNMEDAVRILRKYPVGIMLCDIEMPQGSGLELTKWVRENGMDVEVIFLTGHAEFTYATEALRLGAVDYLLKPVEKEALMRALKKAASRMPECEGDFENLNAQKIVERAKEYIKENCAREINRAEVAERFFIHPDYLSHIFRDWAGITFQDYVIKMRIDKAKKMLIYTDAPISNIADQAGYSNTAYFAKHFKRETGMTPKEYRHSARTLGKYS